MKTSISNPKTELLLSAGLDVLHFESVEWLETLAFWKDEVSFFDNLLKKKEDSLKKNPEYEKMLKDLDKIYIGLFEYLEDDIMKHEKLLSKIVQGKKDMSDNDYREQHRLISIKMDTFTSDFKIFKRIVFDYSKGL